MKNPSHVIFYDGECALCHGFVLFVLKRDQAGVFFFSPIQGARFQSAFANRPAEELPDSIAYQAGENEPVFYSDAVIEILRILPSPWPLLALFVNFFPKCLRDFGYRVVAKFRKRIFGTKSELCPILPPELRGRFLD